MKMDWKNITKDEYDDWCRGLGITISPEQMEDIWIVNKFHQEHMNGQLTTIFRSGSSGGNTTNGGQLTWTWPVGVGNTVNPPVSTTPAVTQILYRRSTHDENGNAKQFTKEQEQLWHDLASISTMTSPYIWKTAEEIYKDATDYQKRTNSGSVYISLDMVETSLTTLVDNGMVEGKNA